MRRFVYGTQNNVEGKLRELVYFDHVATYMEDQNISINHEASSRSRARS